MAKPILVDPELSYLAELLDELRDAPGVFDLDELWNCLDQVLPTLPLERQLEVAGQVVTEAAIALDSNAERLMQDWEDTTNPDGPVLRQNLFAGIVRYNMELDLSDLQSEQVQLSLLPLKYSPRTPRLEAEEDESVAAPVEKEQVMELLDALDQSEEAIREQLAQLAGGEEVCRWQSAIATVMKQAKLPIPLREVQSRSNLALVEVWLGLLLGGYRLTRQGEDFYDAGQIWVEAN